MLTRAWNIEGYNGERRVFARSVSGRLGDANIKAILQRLVCGHLGDDEIISASLHPKMPHYRPDLEIIRTDGKRYGWMTNGNPHYVAWKERADA